MEEQTIESLFSRELNELIKETIAKEVEKQLREQNTNSEKKELMGRQEVLSYLQVSNPTLNKWVEQGFLDKVRLGKRVMYYYDQVEQLRVNGTQQALVVTTTPLTDNYERD